jgi:hypothetical protein
MISQLQDWKLATGCPHNYIAIIVTANCRQVSGGKTLDYGRNSLLVGSRSSLVSAVVTRP